MVAAMLNLRRAGLDSLNQGGSAGLPPLLGGIPVITAQPPCFGQSVLVSQKSTDKDTKTPKITDKDKAKNHRQGQIEKAPSYYSQSVSLCISREGLKNLLESYHQLEWCSSHRLNGLLSLVAYLTSKNRPTGFQISGELAQEYCSQIKRPKNSRTVCSPLPVLQKIGMLEIVHKALWRHHLRQATVYRLAENYANRKIEEKTSFSPAQAQKHADAFGRKERRLNKKHPIRAGILDSLQQLSFADSARPIIAKLEKQGTEGIVRAIDCKEHRCTFDNSGTVNTAISSLPRELKPHLRQSGEAAGFHDISHAHHCWLPRILEGRMDYHRDMHNGAWAICILLSFDYLSKNPYASIFRMFVAQDRPELKFPRFEREKAHLLDFLNSGDYYTKWIEDDEGKTDRDKIKELANRLLNFKTEMARNIPLYRKWKSKFPLVFGIIEDIKNSKSRGHRAICIQLRYFTAQAMTAALKELQAMGIGAVPQNDAILCQRIHREIVCKVLGRAVYNESHGVCCKVDGIRFAP